MANYSMFCISLWGLKKSPVFFFFFRQTESTGIIIPFWKTKHSKFPLMIIVVLGMACVSLGSLCGICDFIRGLNFRSEVGLRSGKHVLKVFAVVKLSLWTQSSSASVSFWDKQTEEETPKKPNVTAVVVCRYQPPVCFSYQIQPLTILFSNSTRPSEAREALPQSCNLSCSRLMRIAGCCWARAGREARLYGSSVMSSVHRQSGHRSNPPQALQTVPQRSHRSPV